MPVEASGPELNQIFDLLMQKLDSVLDDLADQIIQEANKLLREGDFTPAVGVGAFDTGYLSKTGIVSKREFLDKEGGYDAPYAQAVQYGTRPYFPPREPLEKWAKRKLGMEPAEAAAFAYKLQQKIGKHGKLPRPFFSQAFTKVTSDANIRRLFAKHFR